MPLRLLKPSLDFARSSLPVLQHEAHEEERTPRLRGKGLQLMRRRLLARSGGRCECPDCMDGWRKAITWETFEVDHIERVADGGSNSITNLRAVHVDCHARLTARQSGELAMYGCVLPEPARPAFDLDEDMPC